MQPIERKAYASLIALYGTLDGLVRPTLKAQQNTKALYWLDKLDRDLQGLFGAVEYARTLDELADMKQFLSESGFFILPYADRENEHCQWLLKREDAWLNATEESRQFALSLASQVAEGGECRAEGCEG